MRGRLKVESLVSGVCKESVFLFKQWHVCTTIGSQDPSHSSALICLVRCSSVGCQSGRGVVLHVLVLACACHAHYDVITCGLYLPSITDSRHQVNLNSTWG